MRVAGPRWISVAVGIVAAWAMLVGLILLEVGTPTTRWGWALLLAAGPPAYFGLSWLGERVFSPNVGYRISSARFSLARIVVLTLPLSVVVAVGAWWFARCGR